MPQPAEAAPTQKDERRRRRGLVCALFQALEVLLLACGHLASLTVHFLAEENQVPRLRPERAGAARSHTDRRPRVFG